MKPTASPQGISVGFISLGCAKNLVDTQLMAGVLVSEGIALAPAPEHSDVVLVNTCAFIEPAREESVDAILSACRLKQAGYCRAVVVTGCMPQRYRRELQHSLPEVDAFLGLDELEKIGAVVRRLAGAGQQVFEVGPVASRLFEPRLPGLALTGGPYAYLKVAEGCNHVCAFCAIPRIRGRYRSRPVARIVAEAEQLLEAGHRELDIISQDVTSYGRDLKDGTDLCALLRGLALIGGRFWIRLLYGYPSGVTDELLDTMAATPQVCAYFDLPVQHSHPDMLRAMRRAGTIRHVRDLAARIRGRLPDAVLRTTCLVGFPGETPARFEHLLDYIRESEFDHLGVFVYSAEEGTPALELGSAPAAPTARRRRDRLLEVQKEIVARKARRLAGTLTEVLVERKGRTEGTWIGRSRRQAPEVDGETRVTGVPRSARPGTFVRARFSGRRGYDLKAEYVRGRGKRQAKES